MAEELDIETIFKLKVLQYFLCDTSFLICTGDISFFSIELELEYCIEGLHTLPSMYAFNQWVVSQTTVSIEQLRTKIAIEPIERNRTRSNNCYLIVKRNRISIERPIP
uniref:Uncharacterized protein n=1 Tax=Clytia hemisphaerica TaxID=252671 RepID=A0A7M5X8N7_9CNID